MPCYFFHVPGRHPDRDDSGTELPDLYAAQAEAVRTAGEMLQDHGAKLLNDGHWSMQVHDAAGQPLFTLRLTVEEHTEAVHGRPTTG